MTIADKIRAAGKIIAALPVIAAFAFAVLSQNAEAQQSGQKTKTERLLKTNLDPTASDENGWTHLHWAAIADDSEAIRRLVELGAFTMAPSANADDSAFSHKGKRRAQLLGLQLTGWHNDGETPLHMAAWFNKVVAASVLIANGAEINHAKVDGYTPLHFAAWNDAPEAAALLLENGAEVNAKADDGLAPLHFAAAVNASSAARLLLENGAEVNATNNKNETPMDWAIHRKHADMRSLLRRYGGRCRKLC